MNLVYPDISLLCDCLSPSRKQKHRTIPGEFLASSICKTTRRPTDNLRLYLTPKKDTPILQVALSRVLTGVKWWCGAGGGWAACGCAGGGWAAYGCAGGGWGACGE